jgi:hypothetical protein
MQLRPAVIILALAAFCTPALARDDGQWANSSPLVHYWFQSLMRPDFKELSCCAEGDAFEADNFETAGDHYVAIITNGKGVIANGTRISVPNSKLISDKGNPTGHGIIFLGYWGQVYCYVTPGGV